LQKVSSVLELKLFIELIANFRHSRENRNPEVLQIPGFRVVPAIADQRVDLCPNP
jgi:hypothetical protein